MEGTLIEGGDLAEPKKVKVPRTPWDMLRERRSIEELLKERLESDQASVRLFAAESRTTY
jgi:hypothetical protein